MCNKYYIFSILNIYNFFENVIARSNLYFLCLLLCFLEKYSKCYSFYIQQQFLPKLANILQKILCTAAIFCLRRILQKLSAVFV